MTEVCTVNYIDHVGVAVKNIDTALAFFKRCLMSQMPILNSWKTRASAPV